MSHPQTWEQLARQWGDEILQLQAELRQAKQRAEHIRRLGRLFILGTGLASGVWGFWLGMIW